MLNICGVDTCGVAYHSCCLDEPSDDDSLQKYVERAVVVPGCRWAVDAFATAACM